MPENINFDTNVLEEPQELTVPRGTYKKIAQKLLTTNAYASGLAQKEAQGVIKALNKLGYAAKCSRTSQLPNMSDPSTLQSEYIVFNCGPLPSRD